jgi:hypothetical protein
LNFKPTFPLTEKQAKDQFSVLFLAQETDSFLFFDSFLSFLWRKEKKQKKTSALNYLL